MVVDRPEDADRIVHQMAENDHRSGMSNADRISGVKQLAAFGLTAAQIKRRTARPRAEVDAALVVAGSELAEKAAQRWDYLTLDQAAILAEFEDDAEAVKALMLAAKEGHGFDHAAQRLRDEREDAAAITAMTEKMAGKGVPSSTAARSDPESTARAGRGGHRHAPSNAWARSGIFRRIGPWPSQPHLRIGLASDHRHRASPAPTPF